MKTKFLLVCSLLVLSILATACGGQADAAGPETEIDGSQTDSLGDLASLTEALRSAGATVESGDEIEQAFFSVPGQILKVNGTDVQIFEYETAEAMGTEASQVSADGGSIGTSMVTWVEAPHFYRAGRLLVLYVGQDQAVLDLLEGVLGPQFAGR